MRKRPAMPLGGLGRMFSPGSHAPAWEVPYAFPCQAMGAGETWEIIDAPSAPLTVNGRLDPSSFSGEAAARVK